MIPKRHHGYFDCLQLEFLHSDISEYLFPKRRWSRYASKSYRRSKHFALGSRMLLQEDAKFSIFSTSPRWRGGIRNSRTARFLSLSFVMLNPSSIDCGICLDFQSSWQSTDKGLVSEGHSLHGREMLFSSCRWHHHIITRITGIRSDDDVILLPVAEEHATQSQQSPSVSSSLRQYMNHGEGSHVGSYCAERICRFTRY